ncbi:condensation domain-containing protein [Paenibacillus melissococcoides]|uniref:condensation domain-containing protein n=1 Tax=Paenibacillus melissococcoides TaxID=2912268 RepID=UPI0021C261D7|nr:condensation domain-containing protein [Paenibacillus melissococcoides]
MLWKICSVRSEGVTLLFAKSDVLDMYFLTPMQEGMLIHELLNENNDAYFQQLHFSLSGRVDLAAFRRSVDAIVTANAMFRTVFVYKNLKRPVQVVLKRMEIPVNFQDLQGLSLEERSAFLEEFKRGEIAQGFDLTRGPLMRVALLQTGSDRYECIWSYHHLILDGWSTANVLTELWRTYARCRRTRRPIQQTAVPFSMYIQWLEKQDKQSALQYWDTHLEGYEEATGIPCSRTRQ